jgi:CelD/BcsL family acetyltransferase involved in cellulose biosynthesis/glycosyltransferase involved in cell wall biosynthesis
VAYPFAPVGPNAVGGAEQILTHLDTALAAAGHTSLVLACAGSQTAGALVALPETRSPLTDAQRARTHAEAGARLAHIIRSNAVDLVHMHGLDFLAYLPEPGIPVLATLHLPAAWYPKSIFALDRPNTFLHCVSRAQHQACPPCAAMLPPIGNGVPVERLNHSHHSKRRFALALGRICPEKGFHLALDAAQKARLPMLLAGEVFPYVTHQQYFQEQIVPRLSSTRRFLGPVGFARKRRLLSAAQCLLIPSLAPETSSLVAMEALACGTPVIAFATGALPDIIENGKTGWLVKDEREMVEAIGALDSLRPDVCRAEARRRFGLERMIDDYMAVYRRLIEASRTAARVAARVTHVAPPPGPTWSPSAATTPTFSVSAEACDRIAFDAQSVTDLASLEEIRTEWVDLFARCPTATPFQSPDWLLPWWRWLGSGDLLSCAVRVEGRLCGFLPAYIEIDGQSGQRCLRFLGAGISDYLDALIDPDFQSFVLKVLVSWLRQQRGLWTTCDFSPLPCASALRSDWELHGLKAQIDSCDCCPVVQLPGAGQELAGSVPAHQLGNLAYYRRRAERTGRTETEAATAEDCAELLESFFALHQARWRPRGTEGVVNTQAVQSFHKDSAGATIRSGMLRLYVARLDDRPIAALYGFSHNRTFYYYLSGFDPSFERLSPGTIIIGHAVEEALRQGATRFDFLRGQEPYKYLWGAKDSLNYRLQLWPE